MENGGEEREGVGTWRGGEGGYGYMEGRRGRVWVHGREEREGVGTWRGGEGGCGYTECVLVGVRPGNCVCVEIISNLSCM